jgi:hypothetical protein
MSKTKTLGELLDEVCQDICGMDFGSQIKDGETPGIIPMVIARVCDFPVNPGFIVTADRIEAAAKAIYEDEARCNNWVRPWEKKDGRGEQAVWLRIATAAITAAGGIVPDEVVECNLEPRNWQSDGHAHDVGIFPSDPAPVSLCKRAEVGEHVCVMVLFSSKEN